MEIKGTSLRGTCDFVKNNFPGRYQEWLGKLPESSKEVMGNLILTNHWYPVNEGLIMPIETIAKMFFNNDVQYAAYFMGSYHAELTLTGIYKFFIRLNNPRYIVEKGIEVFSTYFRPVSIEVETRNQNTAIIRLNEYTNPHIIIESSIEGWAKKAIEISGGKNVQTKIARSLTRGDKNTEIVFYWN